MRNCRLDRRWPQVYDLKPVDPEQLIVTLKREPPPPLPPNRLSKNKMNSCSDSAMRSTSVVSAFSFMRRIPYTGPNIPGYWSLVIKVYKKGGSTTKRLWFSELSPQFRRGNKFKSPQEGCNKNETRIETVLGRRGWRAWGLWRGRRCQWDGVIRRLVMMMWYDARIFSCMSMHVCGGRLTSFGHFGTFVTNNVKIEQVIQSVLYVTLIINEGDKSFTLID